MEPKDKVAIVTGASEGIGLAIAKKLHQAGAKVVLAARSADKLKQLAAELPGTLAVPTDMRQDNQIQNLFDRTVATFGRIDILINNAGQGLYGPIEQVNLEQFKSIMDLNVFAVLRAMQLVIPVMRQQGRLTAGRQGGLILNISSRVSKNYFPFLGAYASTKYALNAISLTARQELEKDHIVVSVFHPKMTATSFGKNAFGSSPMAQNRDFGRPAPDVDTPEQVAERVLEQIQSEAPEAEM